MNFKSAVIVLFLFVISWLIVSSPVEAALCRDVNGHAICIVKIKRSAKYHYRYRTIVSIDGKKQPLAIYNCRDRTITKKNKYPISFKSQDGGDLVCSLFK